MRKLLVLAVLAAWMHEVQGQDIGAIDWKNPVKLNGGLSMSWTAYNSGGQGGGKRDPFAYTLTGNLGITVLDWSIPLSFSYTSRSLSYAQPFNRIGLSPRYKWVRMYAGYTSMTFSPYSLSGHSFLGAGVELTPGPYRVSVMYGRLNQKIGYNPEIKNQPCFTRMGYGAKLGYEVENTAASISFFSAKDDRSSIELPSDTILKARQNVVVSLQGRQRIYGKLFVEGEVASSVVTNDLGGAGQMRGKSFTGGLIATNASTVSSTAFNALLAYREERWSTELKYERVNPGYETLGAYYVNNNFDNLTVGQTLTLLEGKLNLTGDFGMERSNLVQRETSSDKRFIGSLGCSYVPGERWSYNASYSNFTSFTRVRPLDDPYFKDELDSLSFYQVNQTASAAVTRNIVKGEDRHTLMLSGSYQRSSDKLLHRDSSNLSNFCNGTLAHSYQLKALALSISESFSYFYGNGRGVKTMAFGPNLSVGKQLAGGKVSTAMMCGYNLTQVNGKAGGKVLTVGLNGGYSYGKKKRDKSKDAEKGDGGRWKIAFSHRLTGSLSYIKRFATPTVRGGHELTAVVSYSVSF